MRRYRFGRIATLFAVGYVTVTVVAGVLALSTGDSALLRRIVTNDWDDRLLPFTRWVEVLLVAGGMLQGWAYWQILRGRVVGEPGGGGRQVGLLRAALYLSVACTLLHRLPIPYQWWFALPGNLLQFAIVWLFFVVLAGVLPRWLRLLGLVAGLVDAVFGVVTTAAHHFGPLSLQEFLWQLPVGNVPYLIWLVPVLVGQARDPRWSRGTVRVGVIAASLSFLSPGSGAFGYISNGDPNPIVVFYAVISVLSVFWDVWAARSAHEPAGRPAVPFPEAPAAPARAVRRPWPLAAVAVVLPLIPAAVNLAQGMPMWIGPRGAVWSFFRELSGEPAYLLWLSVDLLVGIGAPAVLVAIAAARRTRRLLRGTMAALTLAATAGVVTVLTIDPDPDWGHIPELDEQRLRFFPEGLFNPDQNGQLLFGLSPLWYSAALAASPLILFLLYAEPPSARRPRHQMLGAALVASVALCLLPAADHARGPVTTVKDCSPEPWEPGGRMYPERLTGPRAFICNIREYKLLGRANEAPDLALLAYGHRLCGVHTRNDPRELARVRAVDGVSVPDLTRVLADICPSADAAVKAEQAVRDREVADFVAEEQRKCDATPHHRPRIRPVKSIRLKEPEWPEAGLELHEGDAGSASADGRYGDIASDGLVTGGPDHLHVRLHSDYHVCVTLETYSRRPPVETKGWDQVVEVGFNSRTGRLTFTDPPSDTVLPDLSLNGRKGHYRIRVHFAWFPWQGDDYGTQRLLIMAYPGPSDKLITYRKPARHS